MKGGGVGEQRQSGWPTYDRPRHQVFGRNGYATWRKRELPAAGTSKVGKQHDTLKIKHNPLQGVRYRSVTCWHPDLYTECWVVYGKGRTQEQHRPGIAQEPAYTVTSSAR